MNLVMISFYRNYPNYPNKVNHVSYLNSIWIKKYWLIQKFRLHLSICASYWLFSYWYFSPRASILSETDLVIFIHSIHWFTILKASKNQSGYFSDASNFNGHSGLSCWGFFWKNGGKNKPAWNYLRWYLRGLFINLLLWWCLQSSKLVL